MKGETSDKVFDFKSNVVCLQMKKILIVFVIFTCFKQFNLNISPNRTSLKKKRNLRNYLFIRSFVNTGADKFDCSCPLQ